MRNEDHAFIWAEWHRAASTRDGATLLALYADDAMLESPLVPAVLPQRESFVLRGRAEIGAFLREGATRLAIPDVRWWRTETWCSNGDTLVWEYPRETPDGDQIDILEVMQIRRRLIVRHRIYWGWKGSLLLAPALCAQSGGNISPPRASVLAEPPAGASLAATGPIER